MKKNILLFTALYLVGLPILWSQSKQYEETISTKTGALNVHYFANEPNAYMADGAMKGIEIDILEQFKAWILKNKGINLSLNYQEYPQFDEMYKSVVEGDGNQMGIGTITITEERATEVDFSAPYLKNVSILVTAGEVETARDAASLKQLLGSMQAVTVKGSIHDQHLQNLFKEYGIAPKIIYINYPDQVFEKIKESPRNFGYVDIITFWKYLKNNKDHYVKMHSIASYKNENFGFIFPKNSGWSREFNEFFESGFGFTATKEYKKILEKHLSYEILNSVELNP